MTSGLMHAGSGLGNQLHRYVGTKVLALDKGEKHSMVATELFKGSSFMNLPMVDAGLEYRIEYPAGKVVVDDPKGITIVDGEFQDPKYFMHRIDEVREWLKVEPQPFNIAFSKPEEVCVLAFRGGEYVGVPSLFLTREYWYNAMENMKKLVPKVRFGVVTDDVPTAQRFFPNFDIRHEISFDWSAINNAHHLILSNSSFGILPTLLNKNVKNVIAPKYWSRHNVSDYWPPEQNKYKGWLYQDRAGDLERYEGDS